MTLSGQDARVAPGSTPLFDGRMVPMFDAGTRSALWSWNGSHLSRVMVFPGVVEVRSLAGLVIGMRRVTAIAPTSVHTRRRWSWARTVIRFDGARVQLLPFNRQLRPLLLALEIAGFDVHDSTGTVA
jgi:hypothetical protein